MNLRRLSRSDTALGEAVLRAVAFLRERQLPHGEFVTLLGTNEGLDGAVFDSSPFVTTFVLDGLAEIDRALVADVVAKAVAFLRSEMEFGGVWRYWSTRNHKHARLLPDLDDTACTSYALKKAAGFRPRNEWAFRSARDAEGRFKTWLLPRSPGSATWTFWPARAVGIVQARLVTKVRTPEPEDPRFGVMHIDHDDVDPVVNANAVSYLGERPDTLPAIRFVIETVLEERAGWSGFYHDRLALYHSAARAFRHAAPGLSVVREHVVARIEHRYREGQPLDHLQTALAASALLTFAPASPLAAELIERIAETQRPDGGWDAVLFYNAMGSEELTTGLCLEVLGRAVRSGAS
ncbi:MAG TPA: hypothetical protein VHS78_01890 [Candidatus Elarobacter sp.]|jgi:hypothetical protein|nr:hypothetical protein [Candidatus Elarobacter sp.]